MRHLDFYLGHRLTGDCREKNDSLSYGKNILSKDEQNRILLANLLKLSTARNLDCVYVVKSIQKTHENRPQSSRFMAVVPLPGMGFGPQFKVVLNSELAFTVPWKIPMAQPHPFGASHVFSLNLSRPSKIISYFHHIPDFPCHAHAKTMRSVHLPGPRLGLCSCGRLCEPTA